MVIECDFLHKIYLLAGNELYHAVKLNLSLSILLILRIYEIIIKFKALFMTQNLMKDVKVLCLITFSLYTFEL